MAGVITYEDYTRGYQPKSNQGSASLELPASKEQIEKEMLNDSKPSKKKGGFPWWILIVVLIIVGVVYFYLKKPKKRRVRKKRIL